MFHAKKMPPGVMAQAAGGINPRDIPFPQTPSDSFHRMEYAV
jgi:hypothetical protein